MTKIGMTRVEVEANQAVNICCATGVMILY